MMNTAQAAQTESRFGAYPSPPAEHEPITAMDLTFKQKLADKASKYIQGPYWAPTLEQKCESLWESLGGRGPLDQIVYDVCFFKKSDSITDTATCVTRFVEAEKGQADALCERLNHHDDSVRNIPWVRVTGSNRQMDGSEEPYDLYEQTGRFEVIKRMVGPK